LEAANWAPTHKKTGPWRNKVLKNGFKDNFGNLTKKTPFRNPTPIEDKVKWFE
tara:strand:+ start:405 stop:563 length:159 start_codon:yes stop_codon:yes gene_type:complete